MNPGPREGESLRVPEALGASPGPAPAGVPAGVAAYAAELAPDAASVPPALAAAPSPLDLLRALRRRWVPALVLGGVGALLAGSATWCLMPPTKFTTQALLHVETNPPKVLFETAESRPDFRTYQRTQTTYIKSRKVLEAALNRAGVNKLSIVRRIVRREAEPVDWLKEQIKAEFPGGSEILTVSMTGERPAECAELVNAVVDAYLTTIVGDEEQARQKRMMEIREIYSRLQRDLDGKRKVVRGLAESVGTNDRQTMAAQQRMAMEQLALAREQRMQLQSELRRAQVEAAVQEAKERAVNGQPVPESAVSEQVEQDPTVSQFREQVARLTDRYRQLRAKVRYDSDPAVVAAARALAQARQALEARVAKVRPLVLERIRSEGRGSGAVTADQLRAQVEVLKGFDESLRRTIEELTQQTRTINRDSLDLQTQQEDIAVSSEIARRLGAELGALEVEQRAPLRVQLIEKARTPRTGLDVKLLRTTALVAAGTFLSALLGVSLVEYRTRRVRSADEVAHGLGLPLVGQLPSIRDRAGGRLLVAEGEGDPDWESLLIESIDTIRAVLLRASRLDGLRVVMVASALKGEGKTTLAGHLAISLARAGRVTLLIDSDMRSPAVHRILDLPPGPGLCEVLRGQVAPGDAIRPTPAPRLSVLTAGSCDAPALRALAEGRFGEALAGLRPHYDFIIVDSAPVLPVADSLTISEHVDAVVFSVLRDVSRIPMVYAAHKRLESLGARMLGAVVTGMYPHRYGPGC